MPDTMSLNQPAAHGAYNARRRFDLSSPQLIGSLLVIAALGVMAGLALFGKLMADDIATQDRIQLNERVRVSAARLDGLLLRAERDIGEIADQLSDITAQPDAGALRQVRRSAAAILDNGPLAGVIVFGSDDDVLLEIATTDLLPDIFSTQQPLESNTNLLSDRLWMVASRTPNIPLLHFATAGNNSQRIVAVFDPPSLQAALLTTGSTVRPNVETYLLDQENRVLFSTSNLLSPDRLSTPPAPYNMTSVDEAAVTRVHDLSGAERLLATAQLEDQDIRIVHAGAAQGGSAVFGRAATLTIALVAPSLLGIILLISVIQNEWRKSDRRANSASDAVARAEVASDILQAGIVDWSTRDASVIYTRGWRDLFGYSDSVTGEQVFDWLSRIHPDDRPAVRRRYQKLMDGEVNVLDHRIQVLCADGTYTHVRERAATRLDDGGDVVRVILVQTPYVADREEDAAA